MKPGEEGRALLGSSAVGCGGKLEWVSCIWGSCPVGCKGLESTVLSPSLEQQRVKETNQEAKERSVSQHRLSLPQLMGSGLPFPCQPRPLLQAHTISP